MANLKWPDNHKYKSWEKAQVSVQKHMQARGEHNNMLPRERPTLSDKICLF